MTCKHGHELTYDNIYVYPSTGRRCCLTCKREQARRWQKKNYRAAYAGPYLEEGER